MKVIVVGAGIVGATISYRLARAGVAVTVVQDGAIGATPRSFGWINASFYVDAAHHHLRFEGIAAYGRLADDVSDLPIAMKGAAVVGRTRRFDVCDGG